MYTTLGAPSGAFGGSNGVQSGTESRMSTLIVPLNGSLIPQSFHPPAHVIGCSRTRRAPGWSGAMLISPFAPDPAPGLPRHDMTPELATRPVSRATDGQGITRDR